MGLYVLLRDESVSQYPYSPTDLRRDNPGTSFPEQISDALLAEWGVYPVTPTTPPAYDPITQTLHEDTPVWIDGAWMQVWDATNNYGFYSYIDSVRITKGVARYTADFTPSQIQFRK